MSKTLEMFYDFSSPYAYLGHDEAVRIAAVHGAHLRPRPFLLGGLFRSLGTANVPFLEASPAKRDVLARDIHRFAEHRALPLRWPTRFPINTVLPLRVMVQLDGDAHITAMRAIYRAYWADDVDISGPGGLGPVLDSIGLDSAWLLAGAQEAAAKDAVRANTDELLARGGCGAPTYCVGDLLVWGQDRIDLVARMLDGWRPAAG